MNLKKLIINSLLLAIGALLHQISPPILFGMRPDVSLVMLFIIMLLNKDYKSCLCAGIVTGLLSAATTTFPGGQFANLVDKLITANLMFIVLGLIRERVNNQVKILITTILGTIVSGSVFLITVLLTVGLTVGFTTLFLSVVLPACLVNTIGALFLFNVINTALKRGAIKEL